MGITRPRNSVSWMVKIHIPEAAYSGKAHQHASAGFHGLEGAAHLALHRLHVTGTTEEQ